MSLFGELKRRSVFRVAIAYLVGAWLLVELAGMAFPYFGWPESNIRVLLIVLALGFLPALMMAWSYVLTPAGLIRDASVARSSARRMDLTTLGLVMVALVSIAILRFWSAGGQTEKTQAVTTPRVAELQGELAELTYPANSIAVLPFINLSDEAANEYFSDGISEEILNLLARVPGLRVISRSSAFSFKDKDFDIPTVAKQLRVAHILEGSVRKAGDRVRITVQLIDTRSDSHLWSDNYDRKLDDIFAIQDEIAGAVVQQLKVSLFGDTPKSEAVDPEAYTMYLQARHLGRQGDAESYAQSNALYEQALAIVSDFAAAWSGLATNYTNQAINGLAPFEESFTHARIAAQTALAGNPDYAPAHANLGWVSLAYDNDVAKAARHYERALQLDPGNTYLIRSAAVLMRSLNRLDDAIALGKYATERDPLVASGHHNLGIAYFRAGHWDEAIASFQMGLRLSPNFLGGQYQLGMALLYKGQPQAALEAALREKDEEYRVKGAAMALHALGLQRESQAKLTELQERWGNDWPSEVAQAYAYVGNVDVAFQWLDKAIEQNEEGLSEQFLQPFFQSMHADSRWDTFLQRVGSSSEQLEAIEFDVSLPGESWSG